jgi:cation diffusion facilitator family transporter
VQADERFQGWRAAADKARVHRAAVRIEWLTIAYMVSAVALLYLTLGSSQAMKAAWWEDLLGLLPPIAFLVSNRFRDRDPTPRFPYGYHRATSLAYLSASLTLFTLGGFILYDSVSKLVRFEHPPIGMVEPFGLGPVWLGWLMIAALAWSAIPSVFLGRAKLPLAGQLHDKVLYADAKMNRANWLTAGAAIVGIIGIGVGLWWADAAAAIVISLDITRDGLTNVRAAAADLMDSRPTRYDGSTTHPLLGDLEDELHNLAWVKDARVRLREAGHVFVGEAFVVPADDTDPVAKLEGAAERLRAVDWRLQEVVVTLVRQLDPQGVTT